MNKKHDNKTLDKIGISLFRSESLSTSQVDRIVANPELFCLVRQRVAADQAASLVELRHPSSARRYVIAWSGLAMTVFALIGAISFYGPDRIAVRTPPAVVGSKVTDVLAEVARTEVHANPTTGKLSTASATKDFKVEKAGVSRTRAASKSSSNAEPNAQFLPVSYAGNPDEMSSGGEIIRVEMKRSSLFAIGVDIPLENDDTIVKADLLIGRDGITRAIRVVD